MKASEWDATRVVELPAAPLGKHDGPGGGGDEHESEREKGSTEPSHGRPPSRVPDLVPAPIGILRAGVEPFG